MADETILTWSFANWITVLLMVILGMALLGMIDRLRKRQQSPVAA